MKRSGFKYKPRRNKYKAIKTPVDGILFDSMLEARGYEELKLFQAAKLIKDLETQIDIPLHVNEVLIGNYRADYMFTHVKSGSVVVGEAKGQWTDLAKWKWKHVQAEYRHREYALFMGNKWSGFKFFV